MVDVGRTPYAGLPLLGYGLWQVPADQAEGLVLKAYETGYRHFDCARVYANEHTVGKALTKIGNRSQLFVTSKLWCDCHEKDKVRASCLKTLEELQLDYLDMYLIHNPVRSEQGFSGSLWFKQEWILETWREMLKLKDEGLCKNVGVSNFTTKKLGWLIDDGNTPVNNQVELHPYLPQRKLYDFCREHKIDLTAYSPLGSPGSASTLSDGKGVDEWPMLMKDPTIEAIAKRRKVTPAQVLLKWGMQRGTAVLAKSSSESRMKENLQAASISLAPEDVAEIDNISRRARFLKFTFFVTGNHTVEELWDGELYN